MSGSAAERRIQQIWEVICGVDEAEEGGSHWLELNFTSAEDGPSKTGHPPSKKGNPSQSVPRRVKIGTVSVAIKEPVSPELVPHKVDPLYEGSQEILRHLRWLMQKDQLQQDIFLIG